MFSSELIYMWTGNRDASVWGGPILSWYSLGNGILLIMAFQYYLQFAYGNLKYHIKGNLYFGGIQILCMTFAAYNFGALGTAITWFSLQLIFILFWPGFIHNKFVPGLHSKWVHRDILPSLITSISGLTLIKYLNVDVESFDRPAIFFILGMIWLCILSMNVIVTSETRKFVRHIINAKRK